MKETVAKILLWLLVINLGIAFGAGLYESRIVIPQWIVTSPELGYRWDPEAAREANVGLRFWVYVTTFPLTLLTLANLSAAARYRRGSMRRWWLGAGLAALAERIVTFSYFIPTMLILMSAESPPDVEAAAMALQWANLNYVRSALNLGAWLAALKALSLSHATVAPSMPATQDADEPSEPRLSRMPTLGHGGRFWH